MFDYMYSPMNIGFCKIFENFYEQTCFAHFMISKSTGTGTDVCKNSGGVSFAM